MGQSIDLLTFLAVGPGFGDGMAGHDDQAPIATTGNRRFVVCARYRTSAPAPLRAMGLRQPES